MDDEHPLEQLLREAKKKDDLKAAAVVAEQRKASDLRDKVRLQWEQTKAGLIEEIARANAVLQRHSLSEHIFQRVTKVPLSEDHDMIDAFPSDRADQPFGIGFFAMATAAKLVDREYPWRGCPG